MALLYRIDLGDQNYFFTKFSKLNKFVENYTPKCYEKYINPYYQEFYEFEKGYTLNEIVKRFNLNYDTLKQYLDKNKKYILIDKYIKNFNYEDPADDLNQYIEKNGKETEYKMYDYDVGFYKVNEYVLSDRTGKYVSYKEVEELFKKIEDCD